MSGKLLRNATWDKLQRALKNTGYIALAEKLKEEGRTGPGMHDSL